MNVVDDISFEVFQAFLNILKKNGANETLKILNDKYDSDFGIKDSYILSVLNLVCDEMAISLHDLLYEKHKKGDNKYAIGFCVYYLHKNYSYGELKKSGVFIHKDTSLLSKYKSIIDNLNRNYKSDKEYIELKDKLDIQVKSIKK
jgi:hypothetical protein